MKIRSRTNKQEIDVQPGVSFVPLPHGKTCLVDTEDVPLVAGRHWHLSNKGYAKSNVIPKHNNGKWGTLLIHRVVMHAKPGQEVDHINGDPLDNRKSNLRIVNRNENAINRKLNRNSTSGAKGVSRSGKRWLAYIDVNKKRTWLGKFPTKREAIIARLAAEKLIHGEFARRR